MASLSRPENWICGPISSTSKKHRIPIGWDQWFWPRTSSGKYLIHKHLTDQSCIIGLHVPSATLWCSQHSIRRLSDRDLTQERIFCSANCAMRACARNRIQSHTEWNRKSVKMNVQRIQLNLSLIFSESSRENVKQKMWFFTEKNRKISYMQN